MGIKHAEKTLDVGHMIYLLMWLTDSCLQIYSTKKQGTVGNKLCPKMEDRSGDAYFLKLLLIFLVCTFLFFIFLTHFHSFNIHSVAINEFPKWLTLFHLQKIKCI